MTTLSGQPVLVTGATGFLGGALGRRLIGEGAHVRALVRAPEKAAWLRDLGVELAAGDLTDAKSVARAAENAAYVFHAAVSYGDLAAQTAVNVEGTRNLARASVHAARFVHVSTISWYGYGQRGAIHEDSPIHTAHDPYVRTKQAAESTLREIAAETGLSYSISRPGMIYGAGGAMWTRGLFQVARRRPMPFIGDGRGTCFPIHVDDVVDQLVTLATHPAATGEAFNCAPDPAPTWRAFMALYARLAGHDRWLAFPYPLFAAAANVMRPFGSHDSALRDLPMILHVFRANTVYTMDKARRLLDWSPRVDLESGIAGCAAWLREQGLL
jgi:nucleoside-diphosphate-sugar epimerase